MKIPNPVPFHEIPLSIMEGNTSPTQGNGIVSNSNTQLIGTLLISFALLAAGSYLFYEIQQKNNKKSQKLT